MADLEKIFAKAAEIAQKLPENLQEAAFNRALDELLNKPKQEANMRKSRKSQGSTKTKHEIEPQSAKSDDFIDSIDRTKYPDIGATNRTADRALKVLQLTIDDYGVDGLTASQIADILKKKFRLPVTANSVQMALKRETQTVDVRSGPDGLNTFHIMAPGDEYLEKLRAREIEPNASRKKITAKQKGKKKSSTHKKSVNNKKRQRKSTTLGPKAAIGILIEAGYFNSPRQISEIQNELKHSKGHTFSVQELSPALVRCVRDESLIRSRNDSGQYEYSKA